MQVNAPAILLSRFLSILLLPGAQDHEHGLRGTIEGGDPGSRGRAHIPSDLSSERSSLWRYFQPASGRCPPDTSDRPVSQPAKHAFQQLLRNHSGTHSYPRPSAGDTQQVSEASPLSVQGQGKGMGAREAAPSTQEDQSQEQSNRAKRRQQQQLKTRGQHGAPAQSSGTSSSTDTLVQQMAALLLRHEDQFGVLAQSTAWVMFMGTAPPLSVVAPMAAVANQWHKDQRERPGSLKFPLRVLLFQSFLHSMGQALEKLTHDPAYKAEAIRLEISSGAGSTPLPPMEPGGSSGRGSCQPDASEGGRGCSDVAGTHGAQCGPWGNHKIPFHEETFGRAGRTHDHFQVGSGSQGDKDVPVLANPGVSVRQLRPPPGGGLHASGENGSIPKRSADSCSPA